MSLDQNLFTLNITPRADAPLVIELVDPQETVHYRKERVDDPSGLYEFNVFDPVSGSLLATVSSPSAASKHKTIELHNPSVPVELKYTGTFTFRWTFSWEEHEFEWKKREECYLIRKPDPPVLVAITKEPPGRMKTRSVQILDYNLNRFDMQDRKGLEIVILSALLSFQDYSDELHGGRREENATYPSQAAIKPVSKPSEPEMPPPQLPPKPQRSGVERIEEMQKGELGEILVEEEGEISDYAKYCSNLLEGDNMLFVILRSSSPATVSKVLQVVHQTKRIRHKAGSDDELHQYVQYDTDHPTNLSGKKGPRIIKLDSEADERNKYKPPESLTVHLSRIPMPELQPKAQGKEKDVERGRNGKEQRQHEKKEGLERKEWKKREKENRDKGKGHAKSLDRDERQPESSRRLSKKYSTSYVPSHRVHPSQPSPSPSQLNNPTIYAAPKPMPPRPSLSPSPMPGSFPAYVPSHQRGRLSSAHASSYSGPATPYPAQRPASLYGDYLEPPQQSASYRPTTPTSLVNGLLDKLKTW